MRHGRIGALAIALVGTTMMIGNVMAADDVGRQLSGSFCSNPNALPKPGACMQLSFDGTTVQGYTGSTDRTLALQPGVYWLTVDDNSAAHNFSLEDPTGASEDITGVPDTGIVTVKVLLLHGTYTLYCAADDHRGDGMYVTIDVGGVGQVGS